MIVIKRLEESLEIEEVKAFEAFQQEDGSYKVIYTNSTGVWDYLPKDNTCVDLVDCGRRIVSVMENRVRWYGAAPK